VVASNNFKQQLKDLLIKEGIKCTIEETDNGLLVVETKGRWRADENQDYWLITDGGNVTKDTEQFNRIDDYRYTRHNYFKTEQEALDSHANGLKLGQLKDYLLELKSEGFELEFKIKDVSLAAKVDEKFGSVSLF